LLSNGIVIQFFVIIDVTPVFVINADRAFGNVSHKIKLHTVQHHLADDLPMIRANPDQLHTALVNVLQNALQYTPKGGHIHLRTTHVSAADEVVIEISDNGVGMTQEEQARAFERFYRADEARSTRGFGLGLAIVKRVMDTHQGRVEIDSTPGEGSTVRLIFPAHRAHHPQASDQDDDTRA